MEPRVKPWLDGLFAPIATYRYLDFISLSIWPPTLTQFTDGFGLQCKASRVVQQSPVGIYSYSYYHSTLTAIRRRYAVCRLSYLMARTKSADWTKR